MRPINPALAAEVTTRGTFVMIRRILDKLYALSGFLAGLCLIGIGVTIVIQIVARFFGKTVDSTESAGLLLAATTFFGLAHTFREGGHVRITLAIDALSVRSRRIVEVFNFSIAASAACFLAWHLIGLAFQSYRYNDVSPGLLAIPFWIPQAAAAAGVCLFAIAILDGLFWTLSGRPPRDDSNATDLEKNHFE